MSDFLVNLARRGLGEVAPGALAPAPLPMFLAGTETGEQAGNAAISVVLPFQSVRPAPAVEAPPPAPMSGPLSPGSPSVFFPHDAGEHRPARSGNVQAPTLPQFETGQEATHDERVASVESRPEVEPSQRSVSAGPPPANAPPLPENPALQVLIPRINADRAMPSVPVEQLPKTLSAAAVSITAPGRTEVRIGCIEVRVTKPSIPPAPRSAAPAPAGFDGYLSARNYLDRGW